MTQSKLGLDFNKVAEARKLARNIANEVQGFVEQYTTVAVERTLCRLMGIDGVDANEVPLPNVLVDHIKDKGLLGEGVLFFIANAMISTGLSPQQIAERVAADELDLTKVETRDPKQIAAALQPVIDESLARIRARRARREEYLLRDLEQAMGLTAEEYDTSKGLDKDVIIATIRNMNYFKRLITGKLMVDMVYADGFVTQREQLFIQHIFDQFNIPVAD